MPSRLLIRNGFVVSLDPQVGTQPDCDVLIEDCVIRAVAPGLQADAEIIDATGTIVLPGFVDTHRHTWETSLRSMMPASTIPEYVTEVKGRLAAVYRPEDTYVGTLWGSLEALNAGITTLVDWAHGTNTPEHADASIAGLRASGIRAQFAYGPPASPDLGWADPHPEDARRVRSQYFSSDDDLLTYALALRGPGLCSPEMVAHDWSLARDLDARITVHIGVRWPGARIEGIHELHKAGLLGPDTTYVHLTEATDAELGLVADSGGAASVSPYVEMIMGHGRPPVMRLLKHGITPSLSIDVATVVPGDLFSQMRAALLQGRSSELSDDQDDAFTPTLTHEDVLRFATVAGAEGCGLTDKIGTLTPGKQADVVLLRADDINTFPIVDPIGTVVASADTSNIDTVLVGGQVRKRHGRLAGVDLAALREQVTRSRDHILTAGDSVPAWLRQVRDSAPQKGNSQ